jgi:hypothetical protein
MMFVPEEPLNGPGQVQGSGSCVLPKTAKFASKPRAREPSGSSAKTRKHPQARAREPTIRLSGKSTGSHRRRAGSGDIIDVAPLCKRHQSLPGKHGFSSSHKGDREAGYVRGALKAPMATWPASARTSGVTSRLVAISGHAQEHDQRRRKMGRRRTICNPLAEDTAGAERQSDACPRAANCVFGYYPAAPTSCCPA